LDHVIEGRPRYAIDYTYTYLIGLFCVFVFFPTAFFDGFGKIVLLAITTTCLPENFFSNSLTILAWIFWKALSCGYGTQMMTACFLYPTDSCLAPAICNSLSCGLRSVDCSRSVSACCASWIVDLFEIRKLVDR
jgi:hypothetical protein